MLREELASLQIERKQKRENPEIPVLAVLGETTASHIQMVKDNIEKYFE